jgi:fructose-1-phosphate kinase PfkB-like protein
MASVPDSGNELAGSRDALVAGFVPGIALAWSWPDTLRHAVALAASVISSGEADLAAYEELLPLVEVTGPRASWLANSQRAGSG